MFRPEKGMKSLGGRPARQASRVCTLMAVIFFFYLYTSPPQSRWRIRIRNRPGSEVVQDEAATLLPDGHLGLRHRLVVRPQLTMPLSSASKPMESGFEGGGLASASISTVAGWSLRGFLPLVRPPRARLVKLDSHDPPDACTNPSIS
jgi:hypothetical protein